MPSIIAIPAFNDNYIWMIRRGSNAAVVDPGDAAPVLDRLARDGLDLTAIVTTHHHADHVGGNVALLARHDVPVFAPARERIPGATRKLADVVISMPQWSTSEYRAAFLDSQLTWRDEMYAAGTDHVIGADFHWAGAISITPGGV